MTVAAETPVVFLCGDDKLVGIHHSGDANATVGILFIVGGPQYRVGSHRQFVLMARQLAAAGHAVFRFDVRGMGDSEGLARTFEFIEGDIAAAIDAFAQETPGLRHVVLLGLCDAASASLMYASDDERVSGLVLLNPWARTQAGEARAYLRHYYLARILQKSFWRKVFSGRFNVRESIGDLSRKVSSVGGDTKLRNARSVPGPSFLVRMERGITRFEGRVLLLISGRDLTAAEFLEAIHRSKNWQDAIKRIQFTSRSFPRADHTMSRIEDLTEAGKAVIDWIESEF
jgi:uncharacterized protein